VPPAAVKFFTLLISAVLSFESGISCPDVGSTQFVVSL